MQNLDKLTKQMDALTYNSRSVLNALIRSVVTAGSYNGFRATKAGHEIVLDRVDIFRLYTFYQDWQNLEFLKQESFDDLRLAHDNKYIRTATTNVEFAASDSPTTEALVKHSKILFLTVENESNFDDDTYWLELIRTDADPKGIIDSAPIPINIRTPIYDENLSTKHFSQFETYLFPYGYHSFRLLGYQGDGVDHSAGGKSWYFDVDNEFYVHSQRAVFGLHSPENKITRDALYNNTLMQYSLAFGTESYAVGNNSLAGGSNSFAMRSLTVSIGENNLVSDDFSAIVGGRNNRISDGYACFIAAGQHNVIGGGSSFAANCGNSIGGAAMKFTRDTTVATAGSIIKTNCASGDTITEGDCVYKLYSSGGVIITNGTAATLAPNQIIIQKSTLDALRLSEPDIAKDDYVSITSVTALVDGKEQTFTDPKVKPTICHSYKVLSSSKVDGGNFIVTLEGFNGVVDGVDVYGGVIVKYSTARFKWNDSVKDSDARKIYNGRYSAVFGYNNIASGTSQTVVGAYNLPLLDARFIVGIGPNESTKSEGPVNATNSRDNGLVVSDRYSYMKTYGSRIVTGVSSYDNTTLFGASFATPDADYRKGIYKVTGAYSIVSDDTYTGFHNVQSSNATMTVNDNGIKINMKGMDGKSITSLLGSKTGTTVLYAGTLPGSNDTAGIYGWETNTSMGQSEVNIYGEDGINLKTGNSIWLNAVKVNDSRLNQNSPSYIFAFFDQLDLRGRTYRALTATCDARSFNIYSDTDGNSKMMRQNRISRSGFYFNWAANVNDYSWGYDVNGTYDASENWGRPEGVWSHYVSCNAYHTLVSSYVYSTGELHYTKNHGTTTNKYAYDVAGLVLPGGINKEIEKGTEVPHIAFYTNTIYGDGNGGQDPSKGLHMAEELAYMSDLDGCANKVFASLTPYVSDGPLWTLSSYNGIVTPGSYQYYFGSTQCPTLHLNPGYEVIFYGKHKTSKNARGHMSSLWSYSSAESYTSSTAVTNANMFETMTNVTGGEPYASSSNNAMYAVVYNTSGTLVTLQQLIKNICVMYQAGTMHVAFDMIFSLGDMDSLTQGGVHSDGVMQYGNNVHSWFITIPIDKNFAEHVRPVWNTHSKTGINLTGRAYYTGDTNVWATGYISDYTNKMITQSEGGNTIGDYRGHTIATKKTPCIQISMATAIDANEKTQLAANTFYHVQLCGPATYIKSTDYEVSG